LQLKLYILAISETKLNYPGSIINDEYISIQNYQLLRLDRARQGGSMVLLIHDSFIYQFIDVQEEYPEIIIPNELEFICIRIKPPSSKPMIIISIYSPPHINYKDLCQFLNSILNYVSPVENN